jgi:hypothetical protein
MKKAINVLITFILLKIFLFIFFMGLYVTLTIITNENNLVINIKYYDFLLFLITLMSIAMTVVIFEQKDKNNETKIP